MFTWQGGGGYGVRFSLAQVQRLDIVDDAQDAENVRPGVIKAQQRNDEEGLGAHGHHDAGDEHAVVVVGGIQVDEFEFEFGEGVGEHDEQVFFLFVRQRHVSHDFVAFRQLQPFGVRHVSLEHVSVLVLQVVEHHLRKCEACCGQGGAFFRQLDRRLHPRCVLFARGVDQQWRSMQNVELEQLQLFVG